jgi:hypothetical protein
MPAVSPLVFGGDHQRTDYTGKDKVRENESLSGRQLQCSDSFIIDYIRKMSLPIWEIVRQVRGIWLCRPWKWQNLSTKTFIGSRAFTSANPQLRQPIMVSMIGSAPYWVKRTCPG